MGFWGNEDDIKRINKSKTLRAVKELCTKYLCEANKPTFTFVCDADMYISYSAMNKEAKLQFKYYPTYNKVVVNTLFLYDRYFRSNWGSERKWMILKEFPEFSVKQDALYIDVWFWKQNEVVQIDIL